MNWGKDKIYSYDRFVPSRASIDFDAAFSNFYYKRMEIYNENDHLQLPSYNKRLKYRNTLEKVSNLNQRIFKTESPYTKITKTYEDQIWPCFPRKKPMLINERILDLPTFNRGFHIPNTIDWSSKDIIVTSVSNRIVVGEGLMGKQIATEVVTEFEDDVGTSVAWSGNGVYLAVGTESGMMQIWNMEKKAVMMEAKCCAGRKCTVTVLQWHPLQHSLAWACSNGKISRMNFRDNITTEVEAAHDGCVCNLKYSPKANYLCSSGDDGYVRIWRGDSCEPYMEIEMSNPVRAIAWHPWRSGLLAVGEAYPSSGSLSIWNVNTAKMQYIRKPSKLTGIKVLDFNKLTGELVCSQTVHSDDQEYCELIVLGGPEYVVDIITEQSGCISSLLWNSDGTKLGTAGSDETFKVWNYCQPRKKLTRKNKKYFMAFNECHTTVR